MNAMSVGTKLMTALLVGLIGALAGILTVVDQGSALRTEVEQYPLQSTQVSLTGVSDDAAPRVVDVLGRFGETAGHAVVRVDRSLSDDDGTLTGLRIGVVTDPAAAPADLGLEFLGTELVSPSTVAELMRSETTASIGLDANAADVIANLPLPALAPRVSVVQLSHLIETSGTIDGTYRVVGADQAQLDALLASLETLTGRSTDLLLAAPGGSETDDGLVAALLTGILVAASLLLLLLITVETLRSFRVLGVHRLLGRSALAFAVSLLAPVLVAGAGAMLLSAALTVVLSPGFNLTPALGGVAATAAALAAAPVLVSVLLTVTMLLTVKPVDAILGRFSKRRVLAALSVFQVLAIGAFSLTLIFLDGPIEEVAALSDLGRSWSTVAETEILYRTSGGDDEASIAGRSDDLAVDFYSWYRSIAADPGVAFEHTEHFDRTVLDQWSGVYDSVPLEPFWYFVVSPDALRAQGVDLDADAVARAERGERVFLIPDTWSEAEKAAIEGWVDETSRPAYEPAIRTEFFDDPQVSTVEYAPRVELFAWNTDPGLPATVNDPVILVATPQNLIPIESESLSAIGLANSTIKLDEAAAHRYTDAAYLDRFDLADNQIRFLPVGDFVAGLAKNVETIVQLFGSVVLFLSVFCIALLVALTRAFSATYREALAVKRMLGYSLLRLFAPAVMLVAGASALGIASALIARSDTATVGGLVILAVQGVLLALLVRRHADLQFSSALKE